MRLSTAATVLFCVTVARAYVPAATLSTFNSTAQRASFQVAWRLNNGSGFVAGELSLLENGDGSRQRATNDSSSLGVVLYFNESTVSPTRDPALPIPWIALISCDVALENTTAPLLNSTSSNATTTTNATLPNGNATSVNSTQVVNNGTESVFSLAAALNAAAAVLYSPTDEACNLVPTYLNTNHTRPLPIYAFRSSQFSNLFRTGIADLGTNTTTFNSTYLISRYNNITIDPDVSPLLQVPAGFAVGNITLETPSSGGNSSEGSGSQDNGGGAPTRATIGPAPTVSQGTGTQPSAAAPARRANAWCATGASLAITAFALGLAVL